MKLAAIAIGAVLVAGEMIWLLKRDGRFPWQDMRLSAISAVMVPFGSITTKFAVTGLFLYARQHRLYTIELGSWESWLALFVLIEFLSYWYHRFSHTFRFLWASHAVHHSAGEMLFITALRLPVTALFQGSWLFILPPIWLGFPPEAVFEIMALGVLYQYGLHSSLVPRLPPPVEWLFNTPVHHRIHHSSEREHLDMNYGSTLIVFDRLFGTFKSDTREPKAYGWYGKDIPHTVLSMSFGEWGNLWRDMRAGGGILQALAVAFSSPSAALPPISRPLIEEAGLLKGGAR